MYSPMHTATMNGLGINATTDDAQLQCQVERQLAAAGYLSLRAVTVTVHEGLATLRGAVNCYYEKQVAQTVAMRIDGVESLRNDIVVRP
jgi:osmotically-inducible protein OsmY